MNREAKAAMQLKILSASIVPALFLFAFLLPDLPSSSMLKDSFWAHKVSQKQVYDVVFTGDSRVYRGIDPDVITEKFPDIQAFNYGFSSAGLDSTLIHSAVSLLDSSGLQILVIAWSPNSFLSSSLKNEHLCLWQNKDEKDLFIKKELYPLLSVFNAYAISDLYKSLKDEAYFETFFSYSGFVSSDKIPSDPSAALEAYRNQFGHEIYSDEAVQTFITKLIYYKNQGVRIFVFRAPVSAEMRMLEDEYFSDKASNFEKALKEAGISYTDFGTKGYSSYDGSHLKPASAKQLSMQMRDLIKPEIK